MSVQQIQPTVGTGAVGGEATGHSENLVPELWAKELAEYRHDNLVLWALTDARYSGEISQKGDVLHINFLGEVDADFDSNYEVGTDVTIDNVEVDQIDLVIDRYIRHGLGVQDALKAQSAYELRSPITSRLGRWLDRAKDAEVYKKAVADFSNDPIDAGAALTFESVVDAHTALDKQNVPEDDRFLVINSVGRGDLRKIPEFTAYKETGDAGLVKNKTGLVGEIYGTPVYITNVMAPNAETDGDFEYLLFHRSAVISATQTVPKIEGGRDYKKGQDELVASELFGVKVLRPDHGVVITRAA